MPLSPQAALSAGPSLLPLLILPLYEFRALALPVSGTEEGVSARPAATDPWESCGFDGNGDAYGFGIRLGLYFHWATFCLTYGFIPDEVTTIRGVNNIIALATFSGLIFLNVTKGTGLCAVEHTLLFGFSAAGIFCTDFPLVFQSSIGQLWKISARAGGNPTDPPAVGAVGRLVQRILSLGICLYGFRLTITEMGDTSHPPCHRDVFYLGGQGFLDVFLRVILCLLFFHEAILCTGFVVAFGWRVFGEGLGFLVRKRPGAGNGGMVPRPRLYINCVRSGFLAFFAYMAEMLIRANHIRGVNRVNSVGQLAALIVGLGGLLRVVYKIIWRLLG